PGAGPSNLHVSGTTSNTITISWDGPSGVSYDVLRSGQKIATVTGKTFTDGGLLPNTPYLYSVRANGTTTPELRASVGSTPSTPPTRSTPTRSTPTPTTGSAPAGNGAPANLAVASTTPASISLKWNGGSGH